VPFKCPPASSEAALLLDHYLTTRSVRDAGEISLVMPLGVPIPRSPATSQALPTAFAERGIAFVPSVSCARSTRRGASPFLTMRVRCPTIYSAGFRSTALPAWLRRAA